MTYLYWAIAFVGLLIGSFIARRTKEELVPGSKYFILLERVVLFVLVLFALYNVQFGIWAGLSFLLGMLFFYKLSKSYFYLGLLMLLASFVSANFFAGVTALIFIFGLSYGTLFYSGGRIKYWHYELVFFLVPLILLVSRDFVVNYIEYFFSFVAGAVFFNFISKIKKKK